MATIVVRKHGKGIRYQVKVRLKGLRCKTDVAHRATLSAAARPVATVSVVDRPLDELPPRQHRLARMVCRVVRQVPFVVGNSHDLVPTLAHRAKPSANAAGIGAGLLCPFRVVTHDPRRLVIHAGAPCAGSGGISCAVGAAWRNARRQIAIVYQHIASTRSTNTVQTTASR